MKRLFAILIIISFLFNCKSTDKVKKKEAWDFDKYMMESQKLTSSENYYQAIELLKETLEKFPDNDVLSVIYNIGYNYYKLRKYDEATGYFNNVIKSFEEKEYSNEQKRDYQKYVILSNNLISKIKKDIEDAKDPYHIKEDLDKNKKITPKNK